MLNLSITKEDFETLPEDIQKEYEVDGDGYKLSIGGMEDVNPLKRALERVRLERDELKATIAESKSKEEENRNNEARNKGDIDILEKSWSKKNSDLKKEMKDKLSGKDKQIAELLVGNDAKTIAQSLNPDAIDILLPHIEKRLSVNFDGDKPRTQVIDVDGNPSAMTIEELRQEFFTNKKFASIVIGSNATGSSSTRRQTSSALSGDKIDPTKLSPTELVEYIRMKKGL